MFSASINSLWFVGATLQLLIAVLLACKKLYRSYPLFYAYVICNTVLNASIYLAKSSHRTYSYVYWTGELLDAVLCLAVIYEVFAHLIFRYDALRRLMSVLFKWTIAVLVAVAIALTAFGSADVSSLTGELLLVERSIAVMQIGLLIFLFVFAQSLGMSWRYYEFGICAGFAVVGCTNLMILSIRTHRGGNVADVFNVAQLSAYIVAQVIWLSYLSVPEPAVPKIVEVPTSNLDAWSQALRRVLQR